MDDQRSRRSRICVVHAVYDVDLSDLGTTGRVSSFFAVVPSARRPCRVVTPTSELWFRPGNLPVLEEFLADRGVPFSVVFVRGSKSLYLAALADGHSYESAEQAALAPWRKK